MQTKGSIGVAGGQQVSTSGSKLRTRMLAQMTEKGLAEATQAMYVRGVLGLVKHCGGRRPEDIGVDEARAYVGNLKESGVSDTFRFNASGGIRFLYETTLGLVWRPISPLRRRMLEDMALRGFTEKTQSSYIRAVEGLSRYHRRAPDSLSDEDSASRRACPGINSGPCAISRPVIRPSWAASVGSAPGVRSASSPTAPAATAIVRPAGRPTPCSGSPGNSHRFAHASENRAPRTPSHHVLRPPAPARPATIPPAHT